MQRVGGAGSAAAPCRGAGVVPGQGETLSATLSAEGVVSFSPGISGEIKRYLNRQVTFSGIEAFWTRVYLDMLSLTSSELKLTKYYCKTFLKSDKPITGLAIHDCRVQTSISVLRRNSLIALLKDHRPSVSRERVRTAFVLFVSVEPSA